MRIHISKYMNLIKLTENRWVAGSVLALASIIVATILSTFDVFENLELKTIDARFVIRGTVPKPDTSIVIVAIDDASLGSLPSKWPYPRTYFGKMVKNLNDAGAKLIVFDVVFPDRNVDHPEDDLFLARSISDAKNVILANKVVFEFLSHGTENTYVPPLVPPLKRTGAPWGIVNIIMDADAVLRRYMLYQPVGRWIYYPIGIQAVSALQGSNTKIMEETKDGKFMIGDIAVPKVSANSIYINYQGPPGTFRTYSLSDILDDENFDLLGDEDTDAFEMHKLWGTFRDKIVLVGASADELQDNRHTPFFQYESKKQQMPGVEMHANAISTILRRDFITNMNGWLQLFFLLFWTLLAAYIAKSFKPFRALGVVVVELIIISAFVYLVFAVQKGVVDLIRPMLSVVLCYVANVVHQTVTEQREKQRYRQTFQQYVAKNVVDEMLSSNELPQFGGERRELTILFSDIRKFTTFSENHPPEVVVSRLSEYLTSMVEIIFKHNGTLDKFVGDEIMAVYGAPLYFTDHAERACLTAMDMVEKLRKIQKKWSEDRKDFFHIGIGVNTGSVIVGNLGSSQLFDYTVIGDEVNLGARLEGANKQYQTTVIISESTYARVKTKAKVRELDLVRVMGKETPIRIFELRGMNSVPEIEQDYIIDIFTEGLKAYRNRRWADALKEFRRVLRYFPSDGPAKVYTKRCLDFIENPPPIDWDGVYDFKTK